jgi:hypothetical protein
MRADADATEFQGLQRAAKVCLPQQKEKNAKSTIKVIDRLRFIGGAEKKRLFDRITEP